MPQREQKDEISKARMRQEYRKSPERRKGQIRYTVYAIIGGVYFALIFYTGSTMNDIRDVQWSEMMGSAIGATLGLIMFGCFLLMGRGVRVVYWRRFRDRYLLEQYERIGERQADALEGELQFSALWRLNEERLSVYHQIATNQADASFRNAQKAIAAGFIVVVASAGAVLFARGTTTEVTIGALGAVGAALAGYIARTFLRLEESAAAHLRSYFYQPEEHFRYLVAERLLRSGIDGELRDSLNYLIQGIAGPSDLATRIARANDGGKGEGAARV